MPKRPSKRGSEEQRILDLIKKVKYDNDQNCYNELHFYMKSYIDLFCNKFIIAGLAKDDIEQECLFALRYKAIDDYNPSRGSFKTFAVLCIKRHLFSKIKENNQHKKKAMTVAMSLDESREEDSELLMLRNIIASNEMTADEELSKLETNKKMEDALLQKLSDLEKDVYYLYIQKYHYEEIVDILKENGRKDITKKATDNAVQRLKTKSQSLFKNEDFD